MLWTVWFRDMFIAKISYWATYYCSLYMDFRKVCWLCKQLERTWEIGKELQAQLERKIIFKNDNFKEIILIFNSLQNLLDLQAAGIMSKKIHKMLNMLRLVVSLWGSWNHNWSNPFNVAERNVARKRSISKRQFFFQASQLN